MDRVTLPGTVGLTHVGGVGGRLIRWGQALDGARWPQWEHALIAVGDGTIVEARPDGAVRVPEGQATGDGIWWWAPLVGQSVRVMAAEAAVGMVGTPYGWVDYAALAAVRLGLRHVLPGVEHRAASDTTMICSQLVAAAYEKAGIQLVPGHPAWDVTPADLADQAHRDGWAAA